MNKFNGKQCYSIIGHKGSGKDTAADLIQDMGVGWANLKFASRLREICHKVFDVSYENLEDAELKEKKSLSIDIDGYIGSLSSITGLKIKKRKLHAFTPRQLLQYVGTDYVRSIDDNYWCSYLKNEIIKTKNKILITDCRFLNEEMMLKQLGFVFIKIEPVGFNKKPDTSHLSEKHISKIKCDYVIGNQYNNKEPLKMFASCVTSTSGNKRRMQSLDYLNFLKAKAIYERGSTLFMVEKAVYTTVRMHNKGRKWAFINLLDCYGIRKYPHTNRNQHVQYEGEYYKKCCLCVQLTPIKNYSKSRREWDGLSNYCKICASENSAKYAKNISIYNIHRIAKNRAKYKGMEFTLTVAQLESLWEEQKGLCAYTGKKMEMVVGSLTRATIDRINSDVGYVLSNVVWSCYRANIMKGVLPVSEFMCWVKSLYKHNKKKEK